MKKISIAIKQLHCGIRYVPNSSWLILVVAIALGMIGYLFTQMKEVGAALQNIGASMAAAAVFYFFLNFLPESRQFYQEAYKLADMYRKLQLLIQSLDVLFIYPYKRVNDVDDKYIEKISAEVFSSQWISRMRWKNLISTKSRQRYMILVKRVKI